ncbi:MAG: response regulator [Deltaproteobacteria bacterium]|nr:response regulator [Deltaproteobacteria bacterium]
MARIMIVEDEEPVSEYIASSLKMKGYAVCSIERSGEGAVEAAMRERPDLVLMDILLEGRMDGVEAAGKIRARQKPRSRNPTDFCLSRLRMRNFTGLLRLAFTRLRWNRSSGRAKNAIATWWKI